jgi:peptide chain release factor 1
MHLRDTGISPLASLGRDDVVRLIYKKHMQNQITQIKEEYKKTEQQLSDPAVISDTQKLKEISGQHAELKEKMDVIEKIEQIDKAIAEAEANLSDPDLGEIAQEELTSLNEKKQNLEKELNILLRPQDPNDKKNVIMEIRAGAGGDESALFSADLFRMYSRYAEKKGWKTTVLNMNKMELGGFKEIIFSIKGNKVYGDLKYESGVHRVQRVPATEKSGRVHTSTATVAVLPEVEGDVGISIEPKDLRIDTYRASGAGGQHVNKTDSAIRITHLPTGLVVTCQSERSQAQNKDRAMTILKSKLYAAAEEKRAKELGEARKSQIGTGDRSEKIRTYNYPQDRITDHRIKKSWNNIVSILDGELGQIIETLKEEDRK